MDNSREVLSKASALLDGLAADLRRGQAPDAQALARTLAEASRCELSVAAIAVGRVLRDTEEIKSPSLPPVLAAWRFFRPHVERSRWLVTDSADVRGVVERLNHEASQSNFADKLLSSVGLTDGGYWLKQTQDTHTTFTAQLDSGRGLPPSRFGLLRQQGSRWQALAEVSSSGSQIRLHACHADLVALVQACAEHVSAQCDASILVEDLS